MRKEILDELLDKELILEEQYVRIEPIFTGKVISLYHELRIILYLGILLFTTGIGVVVYDNIGNLGHVISIIVLFTLTLVCFWYAFTRSLGYSHHKVKTPSAYYDFIVFLGCMLTITVQGYLQLQFQIFEEALEWNTLLTATLFFFFAYRFDHLGVLSLAVTALASFWSLSVSVQKWYANDFIEHANLHLTAIGFGVSLALIAMALDKKKIKQHFTFTYLNFSILIFFAGSIAGLFISDVYLIYLFLVYAGCAYCIHYAIQRKSFLFLLYAFIAGYIGTTFLLSDLIFDKEPVLWFYYSLLSCGGFIYFIITYRNYFSRKT